MSVIGQIVLKLLNPKNLLIWMHYSVCFTKYFSRERVHGFQKLLKSAKKHFYATFSLLWAQLSLKKLFLIWSQILGLLVNTLTANFQYSRSSRVYLQLQIQIKLSKKPQTFCWLLCPFLESILNFQCCEKHMSVIGLIFLKFLNPKYVLIYLHNRDCFWKSFGREHVNESQKPLKSAKK